MHQTHARARKGSTARQRHCLSELFYQSKEFKTQKRHLRNVLKRVLVHLFSPAAPLWTLVLARFWRVLAARAQIRVLGSPCRHLTTVYTWSLIVRGLARCQ